MPAHRLSSSKGHRHQVLGLLLMSHHPAFDLWALPRGDDFAPPGHIGSINSSVSTAAVSCPLNQTSTAEPALSYPGSNIMQGQDLSVTSGSMGRQESTARCSSRDTRTHPPVSVPECRAIPRRHCHVAKGIVDILGIPRTLDYHGAENS